ncbi:MAG: hypothetical protein ACI9Y1_001368 [Lentisphaeria bacterium]|jgi:hypothetical protein
MALSDKQRQKKLEKKNKKRKLVKKLLDNSVRSMHKASDWCEYPIHECLMPKSIAETGIGYVIVTRKTPDGSIAVSAFVVDVYCMGVKNALFKVAGEHEYENTLKPRLTERSGEEIFEHVHPSCARKLVEGAVHYAKELGIAPHQDYKNAKGIFGSVDAGSCAEKYVYGGNNGKPYYIRGPNESVVEAKRIVSQLKMKCGDGNFEYLLMLEDEIFE